MVWLANYHCLKFDATKRAAPIATPVAARVRSAFLSQKSRQSVMTVVLAVSGASKRVQ